VPLEAFVMCVLLTAN
ncbi:DUF1196 domain-containing protein, partial [Vibrio cholerae]|nr:DUF1196 domain-containing protein [Vibrio cholerae]